MKTFLAALSLVAFAGAAQASLARDAYWMRTPAEKWEAALPIGNGRLAALVFGQPNRETLVLNETGVWAPRREWPVNPRGAALIREIRGLLFAGKRAEAQALAERDLLLARSVGIAPQQPLAFLRLDLAPEGTPFADYRRGIRLDEGVATVSYEQGGVRFRREAWVEADGECLTLTLAADRPGALAFTLTADRPDSPTPLSVEADGPNRLRLRGLTGTEGPGDAPGVRFEAVVAVEADGPVETRAGRLSVRGASRATLRVAARSDLLGPLADPAADLARPADRAAHARAFGEAFGRMRLDLAHTPTGEALEERLARLAKARAFDAESLLLLHDFCRYLLISSSRPGGLPANLQGPWNPLMAPPWKNDWHLNINLSMHYWPACAWGLADRAEPLVTLAERLLPRSGAVAREMLGAEGWFLPNSTDAWGYCVPFRPADCGLYVCGGAWLLQDALAPWFYTRDDALLRRLLPLLREQSRFFLSWLVPRPGDGRLVSGPAASPENAYLLPDGTQASIDMGPANDQELIHATFRAYLLAAGRLAPDDPLVPRVEAALGRLALPVVGPDGALQEWSEPLPAKEPGHRHISHAYGMLPGRRVSLTATPALAAAIRKSLEGRLAGRYHFTGWSLGLTAGLWARLDEGDRALAMIDHAATHFCPNLFTLTTGAPQVNDMMGVPAALLACLLRTEAGTLRVLPALPARLPEGAFAGLRAENGIVADAAWRDGRLTRLTLTSAFGGPLRLDLQGRRLEVTLKPGVPTPIPLPAHP